MSIQSNNTLERRNPLIEEQSEAQNRAERFEKALRTMSKKESQDLYSDLLITLISEYKSNQHKHDEKSINSFNLANRQLRSCMFDFSQLVIDVWVFYYSEEEKEYKMCKIHNLFKNIHSEIHSLHFGTYEEIKPLVNKLNKPKPKILSNSKQVCINEIEKIFSLKHLTEDEKKVRVLDVAKRLAEVA